MGVTRIIIELFITFVVIFAIYYFTIIKKSKNEKKYISVEVNLILMLYRIDAKKVNLFQMTKVVCLVNSIGLALAITFVSNLKEKIIVLLLLGTVVAVLLMLIIYSFIGKYYLKKSLIKKKNK